MGDPSCVSRACLSPDAARERRVCGRTSNPSPGNPADAAIGATHLTSGYRDRSGYNWTYSPRRKSEQREGRRAATGQKRRERAGTGPKERKRTQYCPCCQPTTPKGPAPCHNVASASAHPQRQLLGSLPMRASALGPHPQRPSDPDVPSRSALKLRGGAGVIQIGTTPPRRVCFQRFLKKMAEPLARTPARERKFYYPPTGGKVNYSQTPLSVASCADVRNFHFRTIHAAAAPARIRIRRIRAQKYLMG